MKNTENSYPKLLIINLEKIKSEFKINIRFIVSYIFLINLKNYWGIIMKKNIVLFLFVILLSCSGNVGVDFTDKNLEETLLLAQNENKLVMIDFWSDG